MSNAEVAVWYELEFYLLSVHSTTVFPFQKSAERMLLLQTPFHESCIFGNRGNDRTSVLTKYQQCFDHIWENSEAICRQILSFNP